MGHFFSIPVRLGRAWTVTLIALAFLGLASCGGASRSGVLPLDEPAEPGAALHQASALNWDTPVVVDDRPGESINPPLTIVNGNPAIAFSFASAGQISICYVRSSDASGAAWGNVKTVVPDFISPSSYTVISLVVVNGNPAISYYNPQSTDLWFVRATDASGNNWGAPLRVDSNVAVGNSLAVIDGNPAIAYEDKTTADLKYIRATNANGTAWGKPVVLDRAHCSWETLVSVNGKPAISYCEFTYHQLRYVRAKNSAGTSWSSPQTVQSGARIYWHTSMKVVNGRPAISFNAESDLYIGVTALRYIRATDANGGAWGTALTLDVGANGPDEGAAWNGDIAVVNGVPAVAYLQSPTGHNPASSMLKYIQALNADGSAWDAPETLTPLASHSAPCLAEVAGGAGIAFNSEAGQIFLRGQ